MMNPRKSNLFIIIISSGFAVLILLLSFSQVAIREGALIKVNNVELIRKLGLTDLCLFSEARYTRHPSQADRHAAFQDHPMALEHFPAGSMASPPPGVRR